MPSASAIRLLTSCLVLSIAAGACGSSDHQPSSTQTAEFTTGSSPSPHAPTVTAEPTIDPAKLPVEIPMPALLPSDSPIQTVDLVNFSSGRITQLTGLSRTAFLGGYLLSPDHRKLARLSGQSQIEVVDLATGNTTRATLSGTPPTLGTTMSWAPDSAQLAVTTFTNLFIVDTSVGTTSSVAATTQPSIGLGDLAWSPDGNWIIYGDGFFLARVHPDGSAPTVGPKFYGGPRRIAWSPTSASFAFDALDLDTPGTPYPTGRIFLSDRDLHARPVARGGFRVSWFPSGDGFTFLYPENPGQSLMAADADGSNQRTLATLSPTTVSIDDRSDWSPDGQWVAVSAGGAAQLVSATTSEVLVAVRPPPPRKLEHDRHARCSVSVLGWMSRSEIMALMTCENSM